MLAIAFFVVAGVAAHHWLGWRRENGAGEAQSNHPQPGGPVADDIEIYLLLRVIHFRLYLRWLRPLGH